jgi:aspartate ammonia-lyase
VLDECSKSLANKGEEFYTIIKSGRTHLQDAVPVRLGREFQVYSKIVREHKIRIEQALSEVKVLGIGGTAAGTGLNAHPQYQSKIVAELSRLTNLDLQCASDLMVSMQSMAPFVSVSSALRNFVLDLTKISNDLRLMDSGPTTGLSEIKLPAVQPGSSIMPGKVNPSIIEMLNQVCFQILGCCTTIDYSSQAGQFELNVMMPVINHNLLYSIKILTTSVKVFDEKCIREITANSERCKRYAELSLSNVTALNPLIGYLKAAEVAKEVLKTGKTIKEVCLEKKLVEKDRLEEALNLEKQVGK